MLLIAAMIILPAAAGIGWSVYDNQNSQGDYARRNQQFDQAVAAYKEALKLPIHKDDAYCMKNLAYCLRRAGKPDEALEYINKALAANNNFLNFLNPTCCDEAPLAHQIYAERGWIYYAKGDYPNATDSFTEANKKQPFVTGYTGLAAVAEAQKDYTQTEKYYDKAISVASNSYNREIAYHERAIYWRNRGEKNNEKADLQSAVNQASCPQAYFELGTINQERKEWNEAEQNYSQAISKSNQQEKYFHSRAQVNAELGNYKQAVADIDQALTLDPTCADAAQDKKEFEKLLAAKK